MINGKNKDLYYESSIHKELNIEIVGTQAVIDNSMRERDTFTLTEALNDGSELKFGSCLPNHISFTAHDVPAGIIGKKLRPVETLEGNEDDPFTYGEYKIYSDTPTADRTKRQIVAYDVMYDILNTDVKDWYDGLSFPMTLKAFRDSFFAHLGIAQSDTSLVNDGMTVNKTLTTSSSDDSAVTAEASISGKTIIEAICEINGAFGNINRDGKFEYVILPNIISAVYPAQDLFPSRTLFPAAGNTESMNEHYITFDYENFKSKAITQLEIRADDNTAGALVGTSGNNYVISGNFLVSDKTGAELEQIANNVFSIMKQAAYTPIKSSTCVGNPCLELGDPIRFNTSREIVETYILQRTLTGVQSKRDAITSQGLKNHSAKNNTMREMIAGVARRTSTLERNADYLKIQFDDLDESTTSRLDMAANQIQAEVTRAMGIEGNLSSQLSMVAGEVSTKVSRGDVVSEINLSPDQILLRGNRLIVESNNFALDAAGKVTIIDSLSYTDGDGISEILSHDGRHYAMLQNVTIDESTVTPMDRDARFLTTNDAITASYAASAGEARYVSYGNYNCWITTAGNFVPNSSSINCGTSAHPFAGGYGTNAWKTTSDRRKKTDFMNLLDDPRYEAFFKQLKPLEYRFIEDSDGMMHIGFVAQDVEAALQASGIRNDEFFGLEHTYFTRLDFESDEAWNDFLISNNGISDSYVLCYQEFIALNTAMIQKQMNEMELLRCDNFALHGEINILNQRVEALEEKAC